MVSRRVERLTGAIRGRRDLRAEILALATVLRVGQTGRLYVDSRSTMSRKAIAAEWHKVMGVLAPAIAKRLDYIVTEEPPQDGSFEASRDTVIVGRPNYRFEVLRLLIDATLRGEARLTFGEILRQIGASETAVRPAVAALKRAGVLANRARTTYLALPLEGMTMELLTRIEAAPRKLKFRFELGSRSRAPADLFDRAMSLVGRPSRQDEWSRLSLSGVAAAQLEFRAINLAGVPRLDLVEHVDRSGFGWFDASMMRRLDDGLEIEENVLKPTPVIVTVVRADELHERRLDGARCAARGDVFLSLLDLGLRGQAAAYVRHVRQ
jgi:DNA-binding Lrp family transcriptional regulator